MTDKYGNNALHLCVKRGLYKMYDHVLIRAKGISKSIITKKDQELRQLVGYLLCE